MKFDNAFDQSKPNSSSIYFGVKTIEKAKYMFMIFRGDAHPIITNKECNKTIFGFSQLAYFNYRIRLATQEFGSIATNAVDLHTQRKNRFL